MTFEWNRSEVIGIAKEKCTHCQGYGLRRSSRTGPAVPCNCVLRAIFRACYGKFRYLVSREKHMARVRLERSNGVDSRQNWGMKDEEFIADFCLTAQRSLDEFEYKLFRYHFLLGADWRLCTRRLGMERGDFFHTIYRIQQKLGRVFRELQPYALYPLDEYFGGTVRNPIDHSKVIAWPETPKRKNRLLPPLRKAA